MAEDRLPEAVGPELLGGAGFYKSGPSVWRSRIILSSPAVKEL